MPRYASLTKASASPSVGEGLTPHLLAVRYRRLLEGLAATQFLYHAGALVFTFELLEGALDVLAFLYLYDDHCLVLGFICFWFLCLFAWRLRPRKAARQKALQN